MTTEKSIHTLHSEHKEWRNKLSFYKDDLQVMQNRLVETARKNTSSEFAAGLEHFQNQLIIQREQIDMLKHDINLHEQILEKLLVDTPVASDDRKAHDHSVQREKMAQFEHLFASLRRELSDFMASGCDALFRKGLSELFRRKWWNQPSCKKCVLYFLKIYNTHCWKAISHRYHL